jgi:hypothetical protein
VVCIQHVLALVTVVPLVITKWRSLSTTRNASVDALEELYRPQNIRRLKVVLRILYPFYQAIKVLETCSIADVLPVFIRLESSLRYQGATSTEADLLLETAFGCKPAWTGVLGRRSKLAIPSKELPAVMAAFHSAERRKLRDELDAVLSNAAASNVTRPRPPPHLTALYQRLRDFRAQQTGSTRGAVDEFAVSADSDEDGVETSSPVAAGGGEDDDGRDAVDKNLALAAPGFVAPDDADDEVVAQEDEDSDDDELAVAVARDQSVPKLKHVWPSNAANCFQDMDPDDDDLNAWRVRWANLLLAAMKAYGGVACKLVNLVDGSAAARDYGGPNGIRYLTVAAVLNPLRSVSATLEATHRSRDAHVIPTTLDAEDTKVIKLAVNNAKAMLMGIMSEPVQPVRSAAPTSCAVLGSGYGGRASSPEMYVFQEQVSGVSFASTGQTAAAAPRRSDSLAEVARWWIVRRHLMPALYKLAIGLVIIPASSSGSERGASRLGQGLGRLVFDQDVQHEKHVLDMCIC